jgi:hypothetical protein
MRLTQAYRLTALRHAHQFLADHAEQLPEVVQTGACRRLDAIVADLLSLVAEQSAAVLQGRGATQHMYEVRRRLIEDHLAPIVTIARAELAGTPALAPFRLPPRSTPVERLAGVAHGLAQAAAPHAPVFIAAGLPTNFLDRVRGAADALVEARQERDLFRAQLRGATVGIDRCLAEGRRIICVLGTFVRSATRANDGLHAAWLAVRAVPALPGRRRSRTTSPDVSALREPFASVTLITEQSDAQRVPPARETLLLPSPMNDAETARSLDGTPVTMTE